MIIRMSYGNVFALLVPKCIHMVLLTVICVTVLDGICNTDYAGLNWSNINQFW